MLGKKVSNFFLSVTFNIGREWCPQFFPKRWGKTGRPNNL